MWKLDFFVLPSNNYQGISENEAYDFGEKVEYLEKNEKLYIPDEFYGIPDKDNITASEFLYGSKQNDISDYLSEIVSKRRTCADTYSEIERKQEHGYMPISESDISSDISHLCVREIMDVEYEKSVKVNDIVQIKRFYLKKTKDYRIFKDKAMACFPDILFHDNAFRYLEELGKCVDVVEELIRHLEILNDVCKKLYYYHNKNEKAALDELKSGYGIVCSGKGSKEEKDYNKDFIYNDKKYHLTCNPHTKLYKKRTDQRIYFCWGRDEIKDHSIIVVRMGGHWPE